MTRNTLRRVEVATPIYDKDLKMQLEENGFEMNPDIMDMNSLVDSIEKQVKKHE